jgi:hypothetical protein
MKERRIGKRSMCAELLTMGWTDSEGCSRSEIVILDDISRDGARVRLEYALPVDTPVAICHPNGKYEGKVRYCVYEAAQYSVGVAFNQGNRWSKSDFTPSHLLELPEVAAR